MFKDTDFPKFKIEENNQTIGEIEVNMDFIKETEFYQPMFRENLYKEVLQVGERDYIQLKNFIITSMKDYYNRLMNANKTERSFFLTQYQRLYGLWQELYNAERSHNQVQVDKTYDLFLYGLYTLGYEM